MKKLWDLLEEHLGILLVVIVVSPVLALFCVGYWSDGNRATSTQPSAEVAHIVKQLETLEQGDLVVCRESYDVLVTQKNLKNGGRIMFFSPHAGERVEWSAETLAPQVHRVAKKNEPMVRKYWADRLADQIAGLPTTQPDL